MASPCRDLVAPVRVARKYQRVREFVGGRSVASKPRRNSLNMGRFERPPTSEGRVVLAQLLFLAETRASQAISAKLSAR